MVPVFEQDLNERPKISNNARNGEFLLIKDKCIYKGAEFGYSM